MATPETTVDFAIKPMSVTYTAFTQTETVTTKDTNETKTVNTIKATMRESDIAKAKEANKFLFDQSFVYDIPGTVAGISELGLSDDVILECFINGYKAKIQRGIVSAMQEQDENENPSFQPIEGNFDARPFGAEASGRRGLTPVEKAIKTLRDSLKKLPSHVAEGIIAQAMAGFAALKSPDASEDAG